ncbi:MAG TPA: GNAT family N-acetyltransferase [Ferruginibacter sp.]|nr:GNAT family N-acetyltransferase [Ferruginibacter sp.]
MMQNQHSGYDIIKGIADDKELENYRVCFQKHGTDRDIENLYWIHRHNLVKANEIYYAMHGQTIAAIYTALPVYFRINGQLIQSMQSIDTITDEDHRGKGLFTILANRLFDEALANGFALIYGFPNENSAPGFFKKLKWNSFGEAPFLIKPINYFYFVKKFLNRNKQKDFSSTNYLFNAPLSYSTNDHSIIKPIQAFESDYEAIWQKASMSMHVCVDRSAAYMNWRFIQKPAEHYYRYGIYIQDELAGVVVFSIKNKHDGLIGYIMELIYDPSKPAAGKALMAFANRMFKKQQVDVVLTWCLPHSFNYTCYRSSGYYVLPEKLRPQKLYLGARVFDEKLQSTVKDIRNWYISYSDSDTA